MTKLSKCARSAIRRLAKKNNGVRRFFRYTETQLGLAQHTMAQVAPHVIRPHARKITVAVTARCNLRCVGCRYGRGFMNGAQLSLSMMKDLLDDAKAAGIETVRLYGGELCFTRGCTRLWDMPLI